LIRNGLEWIRKHHKHIFKFFSVISIITATTEIKIKTRSHLRCAWKSKYHPQ